jgi:LPS-assembly protein
MKNNFYLIFFAWIINLIFITSIFSSETFNFDVTEIEIKEEGNKFFGKKGGIVTTDDGTIIKAKNFDYTKDANILIASGDVKIVDKINQSVIYSQKITYFKNKELIESEGKSSAVSGEIEIFADKLLYNKNANIIKGKNDVEIINAKENYSIYSDDITYLRNDEKIFSRGPTKALFENKYNFLSSDVTINQKLKDIKSIKNTTITDDNLNNYKLSSFKYLYEKKLLKGENIEIQTNYLGKKSDKLIFKNGIINFLDNSYISKDTKILLHKEIFDSERDKKVDEKSIFLGKNDPRISSVSSKGDEKKIVLDKAIFTSCKKNDSCPPWSIKADQIIHDRTKQEISYKDAILKVYDVPVFYFPKFFHPDPSVKRRSGFLQPRLNKSNILGTSINLPYFYEISENKDLTFKPTLFDNRIYMFQNEYRQENESSSFIADFSYIKGYQSNIATNEFSNRNSISHLFSKFDINLGLDNFLESKLNFFLEKVNNDSYLKVFENVLLVDERFEDDLKDLDNLTTGAKLTLDHEKYNFSSGFEIYENLSSRNSDRYQYVFPYYNFSTPLFSDINGSLNFSSNGRNSLANTNNLITKMSNSLNYTTSDLYSKSGFVNNFGIYFENLNTSAKNDIRYKSNIQSELLNIYEINSSLPLIKWSETSVNYINPKISFRINPSDMKNHSTDARLLTTDNIFGINRLGLSDSYESGKSLTLGIDFKKENKIDIDKYLEIKFASILRDTQEHNIPSSSTANRTMSNLFGSIENSFSDFFKLNYDFAIDNDFNKFEHNSIDAEFSVNNFVTKFNFIEKNGEIGDVNSLENTTKIKFNNNNNLIFKTRRNRKISLTEYYDLVYEYQNDCLTAAVKYSKTYYEDRDLKPTEDLFFTITLFPLTTLDQKIDQKLYRNN